MTPTPTDHGMLPVSDGNTLSWRTYGNPRGTPALALHGGPGSGASTSYTGFFDLDRYHLVLFDQRGSGHSTPNARHRDTDLSTNTTAHLIQDIEALRTHLNLDTWVVMGASWGCTLGLAYAQAHPDRVRALVLASVTNTTAAEVRWITHDMGRVFPEQWHRFRAAAGPDADPSDLSTAYARLLADPDPQVRFDAARAWCQWEDTHVATVPGHTPSTRYQDPDFRMTFARLVTHYWSNAAFLPPGQLLDNAHTLARVPGAMVHGRLDISGPLDTAWHLSRAWPGSELTVIDQAGHIGSQASLMQATRTALDGFAP